MDDAISQIHLGQRLPAGEIMWSEETKSKNRELVISQVQDAVATFLNKDYLGKLINKYAATRDIPLTHPYDAAQNICKELSIPDNHRAILKYFLEDGVHDASGIIHAVTRESQNMAPDMQYDVESSILGHINKIDKYDKIFKVGKN